MLIIKSKSVKIIILEYPVGDTSRPFGSVSKDVMVPTREDLLTFKLHTPPLTR